MAKKIAKKQPAVSRDEFLKVAAHILARMENRQGQSFHVVAMDYYKAIRNPEANFWALEPRGEKKAQD